MKKVGVVSATVLVSLLAGCQTPGAEHGANVYSASQVNAKQEAVTVQIIAVLPAKVQVDNVQNKKTAQVAGGIFGALVGAIAGASIGGDALPKTLAGGAVGGVVGAAGGSLVADQVLVDGVSLAYKHDGKLLNSAQVGRLCEYVPGTAIMVSTSPTETRIQPNGTCPTVDAK